MEQPIWQSIEPIPPHLLHYRDSELHSLAKIWNERKDSFNPDERQKFLARLNRQIAIETGIIERLYTLDRGITQNLIEHGLDESLLSHSDNTIAPKQIISLVNDQHQALEQIFAFVNQQRALSTSFIKQLHQLLTRHQDSIEAIDQFGNIGKVTLLKGEWKRTPNNPKRNGTLYLYCPPEQVASEMDRLLQLYQDYSHQNISPEVLSAWFHHRFTQIHPFQDGNGRVVRLLASLIFIKENWFPLLVTRDERTSYIVALEEADHGKLEPLIELFGKLQRRLFLSSLSLAENVLNERDSVKAVIASAAEKIRLERLAHAQLNQANLQAIASTLQELTLVEFSEVREELIAQLVHPNIAPNAAITATQSDENNAYWYQNEIISIAKHYNYWANLGDVDSKRWTRLTIIMDSQRPYVQIFVTMHPLGRTPKGVMMCTAFALTKSPRQEGDEGYLDMVEPLSEFPFSFTQHDDRDTVIERYKAWLTEILTVGLAYWQKRI